MVGKINLLSIALAAIMLLGGQLLITSAAHAQGKNDKAPQFSTEILEVEISDLLAEGKSFAEAVEIINRRYKKLIIDDPDSNVEIIYAAIDKAALAARIEVDSREYAAAIKLTSDLMINEYRIPEETVVNSAIDAKVDVIVLTENLPATAAGPETIRTLTTDGTIRLDLGSIIRQPVSSGGTAASRAF